MTEPDWGALLLASIRQRARAMVRTVEDLPRSTNVASDSFEAARRDVRRLGEAIIVQAEHDQARALDEQEAALKLRPLQQYLSETINAMDQLFGRGTDNVPTSLVRAVLRELSKQGVDDVRPLITVGGPGNYATHPTDLWTFLYRDSVLPDLDPPDRPVRFFAIPLLEGSRALWLPIAAGHEVAHIAVMHHRCIETLHMDDWVSREQVDELGLRDVTRHWTSPAERHTFFRVVLGRWISEVLCDLYAVRRFGPAGLASQCDFLASVAAELEDVSYTDTHPPAAFRARMMLTPGWGDSTMCEPLVRVWREWADAAPQSYHPAVELLVGAIDVHRDDLLAVLDANDMPRKVYDVVGRDDVVAGLVESLRAGICGVETVAGRQVKRADILNAGWVARMSPLVEGADPDAGRTLETIDALVAKSMDLADFTRLWRRHGGRGNGKDGSVRTGSGGPVAGVEGLASVESGEPASGAGSSNSPGDVGGVDDLVAVGPATGHEQSGDGDDGVSEAVSGDTAVDVPDTPGVLTELALRSRLTVGEKEMGATPGSRRGLVVLPSKTRQMSGASIDVRLGREFIVFRRSSTASFSALNVDQRPTEMQERVEKDWGGEFVLHPSELVLAATLEYLRMPDDLTAQVITRSSYGRLGLLSATAVQVQPCFTGCLTLELVNLGQMPLVLVPGERVAQLIFTTVTPPTSTMDAKYQFPTGPQFSLVTSDPDLDVLRRMRDRRHTT